MQHKKSQVTAILIISIIIVIAVASILLLTRHQAKKTASQETMESKEVQLDIQPIRNFVERCLSLTAKNGLLLLGRQGGKIFESQNGPVPDYNDAQQGLLYIGYKGSKISYNIAEPRFLSGKYSVEIPAYPWQTFPIDNGVRTFAAKSFFCSNKLPPLNRTFESKSMQEQLEAYSLGAIGTCLDFSVFEQQGFTIKAGERKISAAINDNDVTFSMNFPMEIGSITEERTEITDFTYKLPVRLGKLHAFANGIIENDINNANFSINGTSGQDSFHIDVVHDAYEKDDIIIITDKKSTIGNSVYEYIFARKNRNPALFYIGPSITLSAPITESLVKKENVGALDPDEDSLFFSVGNIEGDKYKITVSDGKLEDYEDTSIYLEGSP